MSGKNRFRRILGFSLVLYFLLGVMLFVCETADARAGGGHGYSGGGGGGGGGGVLDVIQVVRLIWNLLDLCYRRPSQGIPLLIIVCVILWAIYKFGDNAYVAHTIQKGNNLYSGVAGQVALSKIKAKDPDFNEEAFYARMRNAFQIVQKAWCDRNLRKAEAFLADGTYEQFLIQINEYKEKHIIDVMEDLTIDSTVLLGFESDNNFDSIFLGINATAKNYRADEKTRAFVEGDKSRTEFSEVWTFIRRTGTKTLGKPGLIEGFCPNCGAPVKMGRHAKCDSCGSILRSGEHDWVLANITQACEWSKGSNASVPGVKRYMAADPCFNVQHIEDRVSLMFWRKNEAERIGKIDPMRKIACDEYCEAQKKWYAPDNTGARKFYSDCAIGAIQLIAVDADSSPVEDYVFARVTWSGVPSKKKSSGDISTNFGAVNQKNIFVLKRKHGVRTDAKTTLVSGHCPFCGAPESNSLANSCEYCGNVMNDGTKDWTLEAVVDTFDANVSKALLVVREADNAERQSRVNAAAAQAGGMRRNYTVSDYTSAMNSIPALTMIKWMIAMMLADGQIDSNEISLIYDVGVRRGMSREKIDSVITEIRGQNSPVDYVIMSTELPADDELMRAIIRVAYADGKIAKSEVEMLRYVAKKMGMSEDNLKRLLTEERVNMYRMAKAVIKESKNYN